jgi:hypothetical protein
MRMWRKQLTLSFLLLAVLILMALALACTSETKSNPDSEVQVMLEKSSYLQGEPIRVSIGNGLSSAIYAPPNQQYCAVVTVQRREGDQWLDEGSCPKGGVSSYTIAAQSQVNGPLIGGPSAPHVFDKDLRELPTQEPGKGPAREVPQGILPPGATSSSGGGLSALEGNLSPGTYRIKLSFAEGSISGPVQTVYSDEFVVTQQN